MNQSAIAPQALFTPAIRRIDAALQAGGGDQRVVGGAVRDALLGRKPKDIDLATTLRPDIAMDLVEKAGIRTQPTGLQHGTFTAIIDGTGYEITTLRADVACDGRHAEVAFITDWRQDAERRDLTFNAMSVDRNGVLHDYFDGAADLRARRIRLIGDPAQRLREDYLRILRVFRFAGKFQEPASIDPASLAAVAQEAAGLRRISVERVWSEFRQILSHGRSAQLLPSLQSTGAAAAIGLPVLSPAAMNEAARLAALGAPLAAFTALMPDVAQADRLTCGWKMSLDERETIGFLARERAAGYPRRAEELLVRGAKETAVLDLMRLQQADAARIQQVKNWSVPAFPLTGKILLSQGWQPGKDMGMALKTAMDRWIESDFQLQTSELLAIAKSDRQKMSAAGSR